MLMVILLAYLLVAALFAIYTPAWQAPDEPPHYNYVAQVAENGCCPVIEIGDWNLRYQSELTSQRFPPVLLDGLGSLQYEDHQPPLYYLLASVVFKFANGSLTALRLFSALIGAGVVWCAYGVGSALYPQRPWIALGAAAFVAFLPQHVAMMAAVNNDGLAEVIIGATLLAMLRYLKSPTSVGAGLRPAPRRIPFPLLLGVLVGLGLLTKVSTYFLAGVVPLAIVLKWWTAGAERRRAALRDLRQELLFFLIPALALGLIWWLRDVSVYGWPDFLGLGRHNLVVADQLRTADYIAQHGWGDYLSAAFWSTFNSFWGQFGWMAVPMPAWIYRLIEALLLVVATGLVLNFFRLRSRSEDEQDAQFSRNAWLILWTTIVLAALAYVYYNTEFLQHQGRYLFTALIPFGLLMALGLDAWRRLLRPDGRSYARWLVVAVFLSLALLDVYLLFRVIVPGLSV